MKIKKISDLIPNLQEHVVMRDFTTFHVGGVADYFVEVETVEDLIKAVKAAQNLKLRYFILGNGSNILFSDYGYNGLIIKNKTSQMAIMKEKSQVIVDSGVMLSRLLMELASNELSGLEFLFGIPGTVGGAIYGNAGAWGSAIGDYVKQITVLEIDKENLKLKIKQYDAQWMEFTYRDSKLKKMKSGQKPIILSVRLQVAHGQKEEIIRRINMYKTQRSQRQPVGMMAGSIFRNPMPEELKNFSGTGTKGMPELPKERTAGFMLEQSGVKKLQNSSAEVSKQHANIIVAKNGAKATEIRSLIEEMREKVHQKYGIELEEEIEYVGQW